MPRLPASRIPGSTGLTARARRRSSWPRCSGCGTTLHPVLTLAGAHPACSTLEPGAYDALVARGSFEVVRGE